MAGKVRSSADATRPIKAAQIVPTAVVPRATVVAIIAPVIVVLSRKFLLETRIRLPGLLHAIAVIIVVLLQVVG